MVANKLRGSALILLVFTVFWLVLMILSVSKTGPITNLDEAIDSVANTGFIYPLTYINAVFITIVATIFFVYLYLYCKPMNADWALIGLIFVPIYSVLNLIVYFSQITVVPQLLSLMDTTESSEIYRVLVGQFVQGWSSSIISAFNQIAYAILAIPSIIFGVLLIKNKSLTIAGWFLTLNGIACIMGVIGTTLNNQLLAIGSVVGGVFFLIALLVVVLNKPFNK